MDKKIARVTGRILNDIDFLMEADRKNYLNPRARNPAKRFPKGRKEYEDWQKRDHALHKARKIMKDAGMDL